MLVFFLETISLRNAEVVMSDMWIDQVRLLVRVCSYLDLATLT